MPQARKTKKSASTVKKDKAPPIRTDPAVFERAFYQRLGQTPSAYIHSKLSGGSHIDSVRYLYDILSAEIAAKNHCRSVSFEAYYTSIPAEEPPVPQRQNRRVYNKLVRDSIPEIIVASGSQCVTEVLSDEEYRKKLDAKLVEELNEYLESKSLEELADLLEVMGAVVKARGYTWEELTRVRKEKRAKVGAFDKRILLKEVIGE